MYKIKIGVLGLYRGSSMINYCLAADNAELVAICDKWVEGVELQKKKHPDSNIVYYTDFDEFLKHDMDMVVLANYATEHAPFAIKAMKAGKHVFSEVLPVQTMKEAVELVEAVEETGMIYGYAENYCYMAAPEKFAAIAPICGSGICWYAGSLKDVPVYMYHGDCDKVIPVSESVTMLRNINLSGGNAKLKICYGIEHNVWDIAYSDDELENWLLSHRKM